GRGLQGGAGPGRGGAGAASPRAGLRGGAGPGQGLPHRKLPAPDGYQRRARRPAPAHRAIRARARLRDALPPGGTGRHRGRPPPRRPPALGPRPHEPGRGRERPGGGPPGLVTMAADGSRIGIVRGPSGALEQGLEPLKVAQALGQEGAVGWVDLEGPEPEEVHALEALFGFHPLALEDALNPDTRPKIEEYENFLFV